MASTALVPSRSRLPAARSVGDPHSARLLSMMAARGHQVAPVAYTRENELRIPTFLRTSGEAQLKAFGAEPTLFACVSRLATAVSQVKWNLYRKAPSGREEDRTEVTRHAALDLWRQPNQKFTPSTQQLVEVTEQHLDLTGQGYWFIGTDSRDPDATPLSLWPVRPDKVEPIPSAEHFRDGWIYRDPDGREIPFADHEVIPLRFTDPSDPYHGLGPLRSLLVDLDAARFQAEWTRNFFVNSAQPGGILQTEHTLSDPEFDELRARWNEQHTGVSNAHRVAILEAGLSWVPRSYSMKEMEFTALRSVADDRIMLAFGLSKVLLGQTENVNRATAATAEYIFAKYSLVPRLERIKQVLNSRLLPRFYRRGMEVDLEFDYESPVDGDVELEARERDSKVAAVVALIGAGADPAEAMAAYELPELTWREAPAVQPPAVSPGESVGVPSAGVIEARARALPSASCGHGHHGRVPVRPRNADDPPDLDPSELPDLAGLRDRLDDILDVLVAEWGVLEDAMKASLVAAVLAIAGDGSVADLDGLAIDPDQLDEAAELLADAMEEMAAAGAEDMAAELAVEGEDVEPVEGDRSVVRDVALVVAGLVTARLVGGAVSSAMRANSKSASAREVAGAVEEHLAGLSKDGPRQQLTGALVGSMNEARLETAAQAGPLVAFYGNEVLDLNTCSACRRVDGKWLGNMDELDQVRELYPGGAFGGFIDCEGRERCRGSVSVKRRPGRS